ncbi:MAG: ATP-binding protein [Acidimicrobiales bacterium]
MPAETVELRVPARAEYLALVRLLVADLARGHSGINGERLDDLRLAVSEACANAVEAYLRLGRPEASVVVRCIATRDRLTVEIHDEAGGFDLNALEPHPPVTDPARLRHERGLGIPLMRALADEAEIAPHEGGTRVRLVFNGRRAPATTRVS